MTVARLLAEADSVELSKWIAYERIRPAPNSYWQAGMIASVIATCHSSKKKYTPADFMPTRPDGRRRAGKGSVQENMAKAGAFFGAIRRSRI